MLYENRPMLTAIMNAIHEHAADPGTVFHDTAARLMLSNISRYGDSFAATHRDDAECAAKVVAYIYDRRSIESNAYLLACEFCNDGASIDSHRNAYESRRLHESLLDVLNAVLNDVWSIRWKLEHESNDTNRRGHVRNYEQGRKPSAYQVKRGERNAPDTWPGYWTEHRTSKCWKDQRGKGRNKRSTQYRPVTISE